MQSINNQTTMMNVINALIVFVSIAMAIWAGRSNYPITDDRIKNESDVIELDMNLERFITPPNERIERDDCGYLKSMNEDIFLGYVNQGFLKVISMLMRISNTDYSLQLESCLRLCMLGQKDLLDRSYIFDSNTHLMVKDAMIRFSDSPELQRAALGAFWAIQYGFNHGKEILFVIDIPKVALDVMKRYPDNIYIQLNALGLLANLAHDKIDIVNKMLKPEEKNEIRITIQQTMERHSNDVEIQRKGLNALWNLFLDARYHSSTLIDEVDIIALKEMKNFPDDHEIQHRACGILARAGNIPRDSKDDAIAEEYYQIILATLRGYLANPNVQKYGFLALVRFLRRITEETTDAILEGMKVNEASDDVQVFGLKAIADLSQFVKPELLESYYKRPLERITDIMQLHSENPFLQWYGCQLSAKWFEYTLQPSILLKIVTKSIDKHENRNVRSECTKTLIKILSKKGTLETIRDEDFKRQLIETTEQALKRENLENDAGKEILSTLKAIKQ